MRKTENRIEGRGIAGRAAALWKSLALVVALTLSAAPALAQAARITFEDARRIALETVPGGHVESMELEENRQPPVYEVEVRDAQGVEHELEIDASDGRVIRSETDDDDDRR